MEETRVSAHENGSSVLYQAKPSLHFHLHFNDSSLWASISTRVRQDALCTTSTCHLHFQKAPAWGGFWITRLLLFISLLTLDVFSNCSTASCPEEVNFTQRSCPAWSVQGITSKSAGGQQPSCQNLHRHRKRAKGQIWLCSGRHAFLHTRGAQAGWTGSTLLRRKRNQIEMSSNCPENSISLRTESERTALSYSRN